jgi:SWI/SNF-related matrix-associated actin-dependent regulator of chromatin subfamily A protein 2/4
MSGQEPMFVIVEQKDGFFCEGFLTSVNKEKMEILLTEVRRYRQDNNVISQESKHKELSIPKEEIKDVKKVQYENDQNTQQQQQTKPVNPNAIPSNFADKKLPNKQYEKNNFFDGLRLMSNQDAIQETVRYNDKNCETFNIPNDGNTSNYRGNNYRGRGNKRGGYNNRNNYGDNNNNDYQNNNSYSGYSNNNNYNNNSNYTNNYNNNSYSNNRRGRGGYNQSRGRGRGNYNNNNNYNNNYSNNTNYSNNSNYTKSYNNSNTNTKEEVGNINQYTDSIYNTANLQK